MHQFDKLNVGVDFRWRNNINGQSGISYTPIMQIRLSGDDGSKWLWTDGTPASNNNYETKPRWVNVSTPGTFINTAHFLWHYWDVALQEDTEWMGISGEIGPLPVSGNVQIALVQSRIVAIDLCFANLQFDYLPYIVGTYAKYTGQYNKVTQAAAYKAKSENDLFFSDSPKKLFKGAAKKYNGIANVLTGNWTDFFDSGASGTTRLGKILAYDVWNQYRKQRAVIRTSLDQVEGDSYYCLLLNKWQYTHYVATKLYLCLHYSLNVKKGEASANFIEIFDTGETNDYTTTHEFNYTQ